VLQFGATNVPLALYLDQSVPCNRRAWKVPMTPSDRGWTKVLNFYLNPNIMRGLLLNRLFQEKNVMNVWFCEP
jgi:hypothetical protein